MQRVNISVSMVTYNSSLALLCQSVQSLQHSLASARSRGLNIGLQLLLVDNTTDNTYRQQLREYIDSEAQAIFDAVKYWHPGANIGYGAAHNQALAKVGSDYHLFMNPDVVLAENALQEGLEFLQQHPDVVMVSPRATDAHGQVQFLCKRYPSVLVLLLRGFAPDFLRGWFRSYLHSYEVRDVCREQRAAEVPLVSGCCMYARTAALRQVSGFSNHFFMYFEDFDLSLRLHKVGRLMYLPGMRVVHHGGYSVRKGWRHIYMFAHSGWKFFWCHGWCWI